MFTINKQEVTQLLKSENFSNIDNYHLVAYSYPRVQYDPRTFSPADLTEFIGKNKDDFYKELEDGKFKIGNIFYKTKLNLEYTWDVLVCFKHCNLQSDVIKFDLIDSITWHWVRTYNTFQVNLINKFLKLGNYPASKNYIHPSFIFNDYFSFAQYENKDHFAFRILDENLLKTLVNKKYDLDRKQISYGSNYYSLMQLIAAGLSQPINPNFISALGYEFKY
jgi:hypothetical protein